jgi:hypothetical protein
MGEARVWVFLAMAMLAAGQSSPELKLVMDRLDKLEEQNRELLQEIRSLKQELASSKSEAAVAPPLAERVEIQERRVADLEQAKVESDHKLPVKLTGMLLVNSFWSGKGSGGVDMPTVASASLNQAAGGASYRQTVIGLKWDGTNVVGGGRVTGSVYFDLFGGRGTALDSDLRLRVATLDSTWKNTTVTFAFDKPLIAPMEPDSLAQVGVSPLTSAGNLWLWQPQLRVEQRFHLGDQAGIRAQAGLWQTSEGGTGLNDPTLARARPGYEGRVQFWRNMGEKARIEIAPGYHASDTHVLGQSAPSRIFAMDWLIRPMDRLDFSGTFFQGENAGVLGGIRQGVVIQNGVAHSIHTQGGMAQLKFRATPRITFNLYGGQQDDRNSDLQRGAIGKNQTYAANVMYRFGANILASFEAQKTRTDYIGTGKRLFPHYDLAIAYLF